MPPLPQAYIDSYEARAEGQARNGIVTLRAYDEGVIHTLGGKVFEVGPDEIPGFYLTTDSNERLSTIQPAPDLPGIPVVFGDPEDAFENYLLPLIVVTRENLSPAMARYQAGSEQYRIPKPGAQQVTVTGPGGLTKTGYTASLSHPQAIPYDINYQLTVAGYKRGVVNKMAANALLDYVLFVYKPRCVVRVFDSVGDERLYFAEADGPSSADEVTDVADRMIGWTIDLQVEAELDLSDDVEMRNAVSVKPSYAKIP